MTSSAQPMEEKKSLRAVSDFVGIGLSLLCLIHCLTLPVLVSVAAVLGDEVLTGYGEAAMTVCGGLLIVTAHLVNHSFCRSCAVRHCGTACASDHEDGTPVSLARCEPL